MCPTATGDQNEKCVKKVIRYFFYAKNWSEASIPLPFSDPLAQKDPKPQTLVNLDKGQHSSVPAPCLILFFFPNHWMFPTSRGETVCQTYFLALGGTALQVSKDIEGTSKIKDSSLDF